MKTLLLAAAVLSLGFGVARAETRQDAMHDKMTQHDTMRDGDHAAMKDSTPLKQMAHTASPGWQNDTGLAGGGG